MSRREQSEASTSLKKEYEWVEVDREERSKIKIIDREDYQRNLEFLYHISDRSAVKIYKFTKPRDKRIRILTERFDYTLKNWIEIKRPTDGNLLDQKNFLQPIRSLVESVHLLRTKFGDFAFSKYDVIVSNAEDAPRLKIFRISGITSSSSTMRCMSSISKIINFWFDHYGIPIDNCDLKFFIYCLQNLDTFPPGGRVRILYTHPVFCREQDRHLMLYMVQKVHTVIDVYYFKARFKKRVGRDIVKAFNIINGNYSVLTPWYEDARRRGIRPNAAIHKCLNSRRRTKNMNSFLRSIRNVVVHAHKYFRKGDGNSMVTCAKDIEELVPGCYSAIFHMILQHRLEDHFIHTEF